MEHRQNGKKEKRTEKEGIKRESNQMPKRRVWMAELVTESWKQI